MFLPLAARNFLLECAFQCRSCAASSLPTEHEIEVQRACACAIGVSDLRARSTISSRSAGVSPANESDFPFRRGSDLTLIRAVAELARAGSPRMAQVRSAGALCGRAAPSRGRPEAVAWAWGPPVSCAPEFCAGGSAPPACGCGGRRLVGRSGDLDIRFRRSAPGWGPYVQKSQSFRWPLGRTWCDIESRFQFARLQLVARAP